MTSLNPLIRHLLDTWIADAGRLQAKVTAPAGLSPAAALFVGLEPGPTPPFFTNVQNMRTAILAALDGHGVGVDGRCLGCVVWDDFEDAEGDLWYVAEPVPEAECRTARAIAKGLGMAVRDA